MAIKREDGTVEYAGRVIDVRERYQGNDRYVWEATVQQADGTFTEVPFRWECMGQIGGGSAEADATPEVSAAYVAHRQAEASRRYRELEAVRAREVSKGKRLRVMRGRKVAHGTEGECIWLGDNGYGFRVGIRTDAGEVVWTAAKNTEVVLAPVGA